MAKHSYLYLGLLDDNPSIMKIGRTSQTCGSRCSNADYTIYYGIRLFIRTKTIDGTNYQELSTATLNSLEQLVLVRYRQNYKPYKGNEYFNNNNKNFECLKKEFEKVVSEILEIANHRLHGVYEIIQPHPLNHYRKKIDI